MNPIHETQMNVVSEGTQIEGKIIFDQLTRVHGILIGEIIAKKESTLILGETAIVEGNIDADHLIIDGYVQGDIVAKTKIFVSRTGRIVGNIIAPSVEFEFGSYFEGRCSMINKSTQE